MDSILSALGVLDGALETPPDHHLVSPPGMILPS